MNLKNIFKLSLIVAFLFFNLSCDEKEENENLSISLAPTEVSILRGEALSCEQVFNPPIDGVKAILPFRLFFTNLLLTWKAADANLNLVQMSFYIKDSHFTNGEYKCNFVTDEITALLANQTGVSTSDPLQITAATSADIPSVVSTNTAACRVHCGGISLVDENAPFTARGLFKVQGYSINTSGEQENQSADFDVLVRYSP